MVRCSYDEPKNVSISKPCTTIPPFNFPLKQFIIKCKPQEEETVGANFLKILREYVQEEEKKESLPLDDPFDVRQSFMNKAPMLRTKTKYNSSGRKLSEWRN